MALVDNAWYVNFGNGSSTGYYAVPMWTTITAYAAGALIRQRTTPAVGSERVFVCIVAGTSLVAEPASWTTTRGGKTAETAGPTWQECTGIAALNGDATNTPSWTITATPPGGVKNTAVTLGQVIKRDSGASYQICTTAGTAGNGAEPAFSDTAGTTTADNTATWTSLGVVGGFTGWQAPHARLTGAYTATWGRAGNSFFIASEHAETKSTATNYTSPGTAASPCFVYCVTKTAVPPVSVNLTIGASIATTGASAMQINGCGIYQGISFTCGSGANSPSLNIATSNGDYSVFNNCAMAVGGTTSGTIYTANVAGGTYCVFNNTTASFASTAGGIGAVGRFIWKNTVSAILGAAVPTSLFTQFNTYGADILCEGVDFSTIGSGKTLVISTATGSGCKTILKDCKINAAVTVAGTPTGPGYNTVDLINCDSGATNYRHERYRYGGTQTVETTIVRTGGATNGTTPIAWKLVTTANVDWMMPFEAMQMAIWNDTTGTAKTVTVEGIWGGGAVPNNDDIWIEVEYPGDSLTPQGAFVTSTKADNLAAGSACASSTETWGGSTTKFKLVSASFTPQMKGPCYVRVFAAKVSSTFYIDPKPTVA